MFRRTNKPLINKSLRKDKMKRSQLKNKANKARDSKDFVRHKKQRNSVVKLYRQYKKEDFDNLNPFHIPKASLENFRN